MSDEDQRSPQKTDSFVQTDIAGAVNLPSSMEGEDEETIALSGEVGEPQDTNRTDFTVDETVPDVSEGEFLGGDFLESTRAPEIPDVSEDEFRQGTFLESTRIPEVPDVSEGEFRQGEFLESTRIPPSDAGQLEVSGFTIESGPLSDFPTVESGPLSDFPTEEFGPLESNEGTFDVEKIPKIPEESEGASQPSDTQAHGPRDIMVNLTAQGDPHYVSVDHCSRDGSNRQQQRYDGRMSSVEERVVQCDSNNQIVVRRVNDCIEIRNRDSPSCESIYHDAVSTPPDDTPLMKTTIRLTIMAKAKKPPCPPKKKPCERPQERQTPCRAVRPAPACEDQEGRLARCAADSVLRLMSALEKKGVSDRSAEMVLSPRGIVVCLRPTGPRPGCQREPEQNAPTCADQTAKSCCSSNQSSQRPSSNKSECSPPSSEGQKLRPCCKEYVAKSRQSSCSGESRPPSPIADRGNTDSCCSESRTPSPRCDKRRNSKESRPSSPTADKRKGSCRRESRPSSPNANRRRIGSCSNNDSERQRPLSRESRQSSQIDDDDECLRQFCEEFLARRRSPSNECEPSTCSEDDQSSNSSCEEPPPAPRRRPCLKAIGVQTEEIMEPIPEEPSQDDICPPVPPLCTCEDDFLQNNQLCDDEQVYNMFETATDTEVEPCPRPQDDFMNPFPCPYYPACIEAARQGWSGPNFGPPNNQPFMPNIDPPCGEPPDSGYASSGGELNAPYFRRGEPLPQHFQQPDAYQRVPSMPCNMQPSCRGKSVAFANNNPSPCCPHEQAHYDGGFQPPFGETNGGWQQNPAYGNNRYPCKIPPNPQFSPERRQNERHSFTCEGHLNQHSLHFNCQRTSSSNFSDPYAPSIGRNCGAYQPQSRSMAPDNSSPDLRECSDQMNFNSGVDPRDRGRPPFQDDGNGLSLQKQDSLTPLKREISRLGLIVDKIVEVASPLSEYFSRCSNGLPALTAPQGITARPSLLEMNRGARRTSQSEFKLTPSIPANEATNSRAQALSAIQERPQSFSAKNRGSIFGVDNVAQGQFKSSGTLGTRDSINEGLMDMNECLEFLEGLKMQTSNGNGMFDQDGSNRASQMKLCDCPADTNQENDVAFAENQGCSDYSQQRNRDQNNRISSQNATSNQNYDTSRGIGQSFASPCDFENEYNSRGARGLMRRSSENCASSSYSSSNFNSKKNLPAICQKHREQVGRRGSF